MTILTSSNLLHHIQLLLLLVSAATAETWRQTAFLTDANGAEYDYFGRSVAIDNGILVVGAAYHDGVGENSGAVFIFESVHGEWQKRAMITASDAAPFDAFGRSVAVSNGIVAVGASSDDNEGGTAAGAVYIYAKGRLGSWEEQAKVIASDGNDGDWFGTAIALEGNTLVSGARRDDVSTDISGSVYVFRNDNGRWTEQVKLKPEGGGDSEEFGSSIALQGGWLIVGAPGDSFYPGYTKGAVHVFRQIADATWTEQAKLIASNGYMGDEFGRSVDIFDDTIAVGAPFHWSTGEAAGLVYLFKWEAGEWSESFHLLGRDADENHFFGLTLALSDGRLFVGPRRVHMFTSDSGRWTEQRSFPGNATRADAIALDAGTVVVSTWWFNSYRGSVTVYADTDILPRCKSWRRLCDTGDECCTGVCRRGRCRLFDVSFL